MICLRPHHGMCLAYFEGKGYSDGFTVNMQKMLEFFEKGADIEPVSYTHLDVYKRQTLYSKACYNKKVYVIIRLLRIA